MPTAFQRPPSFFCSPNAIQLFGVLNIYSSPARQEPQQLDAFSHALGAPRGMKINGLFKAATTDTNGKEVCVICGCFCSFEARYFSSRGLFVKISCTPLL